MKTESKVILKSIATEFQGDDSVRLVKNSLTASGKIFVVAFKDGVAFKLPKPDVVAMISTGDAKPFKMGKRVMKDWVLLPNPTPVVMMRLAKKAKIFVTENTKNSDSYSLSLTIKSPTKNVFAAVATLSGLKGWWTSVVTGSTTPGGKIHFGFRGVDEFIIMKVLKSVEPKQVEWLCEIHSSLEEWKNTRPVFKFAPNVNGTTKLDFTHEGLRPNLECFDDCRLGWDHFLTSLKSLCETGRGNPF